MGLVQLKLNESILKSRGMQQRATASSNPYQTEVAERMKWVLIELVWSMLHYKEEDRNF